ncbi:DctP family TRAP transporter solute-binding subunit [Metabacillus idriensis]|uniref:DctP family TRAP transporter solute-binding subunit n=1 Tax=Metabacillus idriensis TaxID=324768 RepID=UPI002813C97F|nr:DctP family TRAP transporter solute-binding subunit [Metabacillus idriensis]MDR0136148.1 DctP family TRAP transporter solute-binding subunit [Metabacillus idriensis]
MKWFISASLLTVLILVAVFSHDPMHEIEDDDEQTGLNDQIVIKFSHVVAENTPKGLAAEKFAEIIADRTDGKIKVEVFPNEIMYSDEKELQALKEGDVQMIAPSYSKMTEVIPEWQVLDLPFIFQDEQHVKSVYTGEVGEQLLGKLERENIKGLALWGNGFKQMTSSSGALIDPEDFSGQRFRIMPSDTIAEQFELLHAIPKAASFNDVYIALEGNEFDGQENTISNIYSKGFYRLQKDMTVSNHGYLGYSVLMNEEFWNRLEPELQTQIQKAMNETTEWMLEESKNMNDSQLRRMKQNSKMKIHELSESEKDKWQEVFMPLYEAYSSEYGDKWIKEIRNER